jgi:hypothetical protein
LAAGNLSANGQSQTGDLRTLFQLLAAFQSRRKQDNH